ncbi:MAG TPA: DUF3040 domain-containing protein [Mycobacteriales bacterium]|jgi:hypothetical protein|nr:DUF3040 domain-containing protein [Mycobacteriales bacterium]
MLSDREQQELVRIEAGLRAEDKNFGRGLRTGPRIDRTRRWPARSLTGFGIALILIGALTSTESLILQGILFTGIGVAWIRWQLARSARAAGPGGTPARPAGRPDGPTPGRGQPV